MIVTCPTCNARGSAPCTEDGRPIDQWHTRRVMAEARKNAMEAAKRGVKGTSK